jgi:hypothetical protein
MRDVRRSGDRQGWAFHLIDSTAPQSRNSENSRPVVAQEPAIHHSARKFQRLTVTTFSLLQHFAC